MASIPSSPRAPSFQSARSVLSAEEHEEVDQMAQIHELMGMLQRDNPGLHFQVLNEIEWIRRRKRARRERRRMKVRREAFRRLNGDLEHDAPIMQMLDDPDFPHDADLGDSEEEDFENGIESSDSEEDRHGVDRESDEDEEEQESESEMENSDEDWEPVPIDNSAHVSIELPEPTINHEPPRYISSGRNYFPAFWEVLSPMYVKEKGKGKRVRDRMFNNGEGMLVHESDLRSFGWRNNVMNREWAMSLTEDRPERPGLPIW